jgi:signal transduction histidine kinase
VRSRIDHRLIFVSAVFLLFICAAAITWLLYRMNESEDWVHHTYDVKLMISELESDLTRSGRDRQLFLSTGDQQYLADLAEARQEVATDLTKLKQMTADNMNEEESIRSLEQGVAERIRAIDGSIQLAESGNSTLQKQSAFTEQLVLASTKISAITERMKEAETNLLDRRLKLTEVLSRWIVITLVFTYLLAIYMLWEYFRGMNYELAERKRAEESARKLSNQLIKAQDQERRKIARDLHDGLGQSLVAAKLITDSFIKRPSDTRQLTDLRELLQDSVDSTRSISHLLYPPLVDELGFIPAARSYLEGYAKRSKIELTFDLPDNQNRLPRDLELVLFRILQEALTNIQRHSRATKAGVRFNLVNKTATLKIWDNGVGVPAEMLEDFRVNGTLGGVGLAGMRERVRERHGDLSIDSTPQGTAIIAILPVLPDSTPNALAPQQ